MQPWQRQKKTRLAIVTLVGLAAATLVFAPHLSARTAETKPLAAPATGETAFELLGRDDQADLAHATYYGYLTHVAGIRDAALFFGSTRSEATARITFRVDFILDAHLALLPLFVTTGTGSLNFYFRPNPSGRAFGNPNSFSDGVKIASGASRFHDIVNAQSESSGIESASGTFVQRAARTFSLAGKTYRFGHTGLRLRITTNGEGMRQTTPTVKRTIIAAGDAIVMGGS